MPTISHPARLLRSPTAIAADQWFLLYEDDTIELLPGDKPPRAKPKRRPRINGAHTTSGLRGNLHKVLEILAARKRPMLPGPHNDSGQLSQLKTLGYAINAAGKWSLTDAGRKAIATRSEGE